MTGNEVHRTPRILVARNDKLGDFMLAWPALAMLRKSLPQAHIMAFVAAYTAPIAELCPWIDEIVIDPGVQAGAAALQQQLKSCAADVLITLFSTTRLGLAGWRAGIPQRLAPATKLAQVFYNRRIVQRRSRSEKPEWEYNVDLVRAWLQEQGIQPQLPERPFLRLAGDPASCSGLRSQNGIADGARLVFIHPGSGGSANNLQPEQYAMLAKALTSTQPLHFVLGCGPGEEFITESLAALLAGQAHTVLPPMPLPDYVRQIACADLFISASTGTLHVAGALDIPSAGFYTRRRSATPLRWQTLNSAERRLAFVPALDADEMDMHAVDLPAAAACISRQFLQTGGRDGG